MTDNGTDKEGNPIHIYVRLEARHDRVFVVSK